MTSSETSKTGWVGFKGPFYPYALEAYGEHFTIESRGQDYDNQYLDDGYWRVAHVTPLGDVPQTKQFFPYRHENKYVTSDISFNKVMSFGATGAEVNIIRRPFLQTFSTRFFKDFLYQPKSRKTDQIVFRHN